MGIPYIIYVGNSMHKKRLENLISPQDFGSRHANAPCVHDVNCVLSLSEITHELGVTDVILKYKLEAMRIRGYDIDVQELERYSHVFQLAR